MPATFFRTAAKVIASVGFSLAMAMSAHAASGSFTGTQGERVSGSVTVSAGSVKLGGNFKSTSGPDLYVYLGNSRPTKIIARLRRLSGAQSYRLPKGINLSKYSTVFIHCKRYNHTYGIARLR